MKTVLLAKSVNVIYDPPPHITYKWICWILFLRRKFWSHHFSTQSDALAGNHKRLMVVVYPSGAPLSLVLFCDESFSFRAENTESIIRSVTRLNNQQLFLSHKSYFFWVTTQNVLSFGGDLPLFFVSLDWSERDVRGRHVGRPRITMVIFRCFSKSFARS